MVVTTVDAQPVNRIQAVMHEKSGITGIAFHQAGEFALGKDLLIGLSHPGLVLINQGKITVSDPTAMLSLITITLKTTDGGIKTKEVQLPAGGFAGKSVTVNLD